MEEAEKGVHPLDVKKEKEKMRIFRKQKESEEKRPDYEPEENIDDFKGWANFPKLCMKIVAENPYIFDSIKCETLRWEFRQKDKKKSYKKEKYMGPLAGLIGELVRAGQAATKDGERIWLSGVLGPHDLQGLLEMHRKEDRNIQDKKKENAEKQEMENNDEQPPAATDGEQPKAEDEKEGGDAEANPPAADDQAKQGKPEDVAKDGEQKEEKTNDEKVIHKILIPGISRTYSSQEDALTGLSFDCQSKQEGVANVIFEVDNAKCWTGPKGAKYVHRLFCSLVTHEAITIKQKVTIKTTKKEGEESQPADSSAQQKDSEDPANKPDGEGDEREEEVDQIVHLFKMAAEPRDILMTLEQWQLMRKNNEKDDPKDIDVEEIDESDIPKNTVMTVEEDEEVIDDKKECIIF